MSKKKHDLWIRFFDRSCSVESNICCFLCKMMKLDTKNRQWSTWSVTLFSASTLKVPYKNTAYQNEIFFSLKFPAAREFSADHETLIKRTAPILKHAANHWAYTIRWIKKVYLTWKCVHWWIYYELRASNTQTCAYLNRQKNRGNASYLFAVSIFYILMAIIQNQWKCVAIINCRWACKMKLE